MPRPAWIPFFLLLGGAVVGQELVTPADQRFHDKWFAGKAELSRYELTRARYGEPRDGHAVLVFVTEPFLKEQQVKDDTGGKAESETETVMKLNRIERFVTGVYDYSLMQSVFVPVWPGQGPAARKVTTSVQDWCGQVWLQLNQLDHGAYRVEGHSYFEKEADEELEVGRTWLEDAVFVRIRLGPAQLPLGDVTMMPSTFDSRLRHREPAAEQATAKLEKVDDGLSRYTVEWPSAQRTLEVTFQTAFPHRIERWRETTGSGDSAQVTEAVRTHTLDLDYWNHNSNSDEPLRADLALPRD
jgi:hypothetical protein